MAKGSESTLASGVVVEELPRAIVRRVVKNKLSQLSSSSSTKIATEAAGDDDMMLHKDALIAFSESARIFIHYLSATANDICKESNRQTINAEDVFKAIEDIEFPEFVQPLRDSLEEFRRKNAAKRSGAKGKEATKKRKSKEELPAEDDDVADVVADDVADDDVVEDAMEENKEDEDDA